MRVEIQGSGLGIQGVLECLSKQPKRPFGSIQPQIQPGISNICKA